MIDCDDMKVWNGADSQVQHGQSQRCQRGGENNAFCINAQVAQVKKMARQNKIHVEPYIVKITVTDERERLYR